MGDAVEFDVDGTGSKWVDAQVLKVHARSALAVANAERGSGGSFAFDVEPREAWVGKQLKCPTVFLRARGGAKGGQEGDGVWRFAGLTDSEDEVTGDEPLRNRPINPVFF